MKNRLGSSVIAFIALSIHVTHASQTIYNETTAPLYMAGYFTGAKANRQTEVIKIEPKAHATINVPRLSIFSSKKRFIALSYEKDNLLVQLVINRLRALPHIDISSPLSLFVGTYYVVDKNGRLAIYNSITYSKIAKFIKAKTHAIRKGFTAYAIDKETIRPIHDNPYKSNVAHVRAGSAVSPEELDYRKRREPKVRKALEILLPETTKKVPRTPVISIVLSGGGNRAMFSSCGFIQGLEEIGVLDATTYIAALSGSTWFLGAWFASKMPSVAKFREKLAQTMTRGLFSISSDEYSLMRDEFQIKYLYHQPITSVDIFGALLGNALFREYGNRRYQIYLSDQRYMVDAGYWPFPIYTAVDGSKASHSYEHWYEFTPYEVGGSGSWLHYYIPTWAFGRRFADGKSVDDAPEIPLAFLFSIFGSAFAVDLDRAWQEMGKSTTLNEQVNTFIRKRILNPSGYKRIAHAEVFNFTAGIPKSLLEHEKYMAPIDGGYGTNLPYPAVSSERPERTPDILIFFDASAEVSEMKDSADRAAAQLRKSEKYARSYKLKFPAIKKVESQMINIYRDETDPSVPVVMWIPCTFEAKKYAAIARLDKRFTSMKDFDFSSCIKGFCTTTNFFYTPAQADQLMTLGQFCAHACQHEIIEAIAWKMTQLTGEKDKESAQPTVVKQEKESE